MKHRTNIWDSFIAFDDQGNVLAGNAVTKAKKVLCKHCDWERLPNTTRMRQHVEQCHVASVGIDVEEPEKASSASTDATPAWPH